MIKSIFHVSPLQNTCIARYIHISIIPFSRDFNGLEMEDEMGEADFIFLVIFVLEMDLLFDV